MRTGACSAILGAILIGALVGALPERVSAAHWCDNILVNSSPTNAVAGDRINFAVTVLNRGNASADISIRVKFPWDAQPAFWGTMTLSPGEAETNAFSKYVPDQPGEQSASITIQGTVAGEPNSSCTPILRPFRIDPAPEPLRATILANRLGGDPPLTIDLESLVTGGTPPLEISWTFADGQTAEGANVTHTFSTAADHIVQLVVRDAAGRVATDRVTVAVSEPDPSPLRGETGLALAGWVVAGAVGAALVLLFQAIRFRGPSPPAQSAHDLEDNRLTPAAPEEQVAPPESPSLAARLKSAGASSGDEPGQSATGPEADDERKSVQ